MARSMPWARSGRYIRTHISCIEIHTTTVATLSSEVEIWEGCTNAILESPQVIRKGGLYYILVPDGGTFTATA